MRQRSPLVTEYVMPVSVVWQGGTVRGADALLKRNSRQLLLQSATNCCVLDTRNGSNASLLLDFGDEFQGGLYISAMMRACKAPVRIRVRLGESVSEAMSENCYDDPAATATNDHAMRDFEVELPWMGSLETGSSGFRFARIDLIDKGVEVPIATIQAASRFRDVEQKGSFECNDGRINDIWQTAAHTVHLNMQEYVWDGIKRDRLVWTGDLHPELMSICTVFGDNQVLYETLDFARRTTPLPGWMNAMCSYSLWWLISQRDLYLYGGNLDFLKSQGEYICTLTRQVLGCVGEDGCEQLKGATRFLDWPTSDNQDAIHAGLQSLMIMALDAAAQTTAWVGDKNLSAECIEAAAKMRRCIPSHGDVKQVAALMSLCGLGDAEELSRNVIARDGAHRFSTFYGYYMLEAMARGGMYDTALQIMSDYWGIMLDLGATTFWEELDYDEALRSGRIDRMPEKGVFDIHADGGKYCYKGYRGSLCHGWASGPAAWLSRHVLGISPVEPGFAKVRIEPNLGTLEWAKGTFPTPYGVISVEHRRMADGTVKSKIELPKGVKIVK